MAVRREGLGREIGLDPLDAGSAASDPDDGISGRAAMIDALAQAFKTGFVFVT